MLIRSLVLLAAAAVLGLQVLATPVSAGQRVALVIGNASYAHAPSLANPLNDATDMGAALERLGFAVTRMDNADQVELRRGLQQFSLAASASEMAVVFYAGHGIEVDKRNFLIPVDARLLSDAEVEFETVPLDLLSRAVDRAKGLRLIILDACRDNPFAVAMQRSGATRSIGRGLASVEPSGETLVAYAAKEGTVAADGEGRNSPYTAALLTHLEEPGLEVGLMFRKVRDAVLASTGGRQEPFVYGSLSSEGAYLAARPKPEPAPDPAPAPTVVKTEPRGDGPTQAELLFWESIKDSTHAADFEAYLEQFPGGTYEVLARNRLKRLTGKQEEKPVVQVAVTPDEPKRVVSPEPPAPTPESIEAALGLDREERRRIQRGLASLGFDPGPADGLFGRSTRGAIGRWQSSRGQASSGYLDAERARVLLSVKPDTSLTIHTIPSIAGVRVFTATGSTYRRGMSISPGNYRVEVNAAHHRSFDKKLRVDGPTIYKISLCKVENKTERVCKDEPITRKQFKDIVISARGKSSYSELSANRLRYVTFRAKMGMIESEERAFWIEICEDALRDASNNVSTKCMFDLKGKTEDILGSIKYDELKHTCENPGDLRELGSPYSNRPYERVVSNVCTIEETVTEMVTRCSNKTRQVPVCPERIVTRLQ